MDTDSDDGAATAAEAAEAAAAAAKQERQLTTQIQAQGGLVLPPEGFRGPSNTHRMFKTRMQVTAYLNPDHVEDKEAGVRAHMDDLLFRFLDDQQAIMMSYELHDVQTDTVFLHPEPPPLLTVRAVADVVTFEPTPGDVICGVVRKLSHTNITLLVLGCISVSIERPFIPDDWEYDLHSHCWVPAGDYSRAVFRGDLVRVMLLSYPQLDPEQEEVLFNLEGSLLLGAHTGLHAWQWPRQQRLRQLLSAHHGQAEAYSVHQEQHWQQLQEQLRAKRLTRRKLVAADKVQQQLQQQSDSQESGSEESGSEESGSESDTDSDSEQQQQQQQADKHKHTHKQQQQQQQPGPSAEQQQQSSKEADKAAKKAQAAAAKAQAKADRKAAKAAEKAARKEAARAEKAAAKAAAKAQKKAEKRSSEQQQEPAEAAAAAEQPLSKKQKRSSEQQQQQGPAVANGHAAPAAAQPHDKHSKHKSEKGSSKNSSKDKKAKAVGTL